MHPKPLWETGRPHLTARYSQAFDDIHALFAAIGRPTQPPHTPPAEAVTGLTGEPPAIDLTPPGPDPRVLDWQCHQLHEDDTEPIAGLRLLVLPPGDPEPTIWHADMTREDEATVREILAELAEHHTAEWFGTLPDPSEVAQEIDRVARDFTEIALATVSDTTGLRQKLLIDSYTPIRSTALSTVTSLLDHAAKRGWTASQMIEAWQQHCNDVDPVQY